MINKFLEMHVKESSGSPDTLCIKSDHVSANLNAFEFQDADTGQFIFYFPALDISGYGETKEKAFEIVKFSIGEYFNYLYNLSTENINIELRQKGWKNDTIRNKEFSKVYVDGEGEFKNFNAAEGKIIRLTLEAA